MKKFVIMMDPTCDISKKDQEKYNLEIVLGHYKTPDGVEHVSKYEWEPSERDAFYKELKKNVNGFTTSPANIDECYKVFEEHYKKDEAMIVLSISKVLSGAYSFFKKAEEQLLEKYPDAKIKVIDSMRFGAVVSLMAIYASKMRDEGKSFDEVVDWLETNKNRFHQTGWMDDLSFIARKGRITHAKAFFGSLVGIKPVGEFDYNGMTTVIGKGKGEKQTFKILLEYMAKHIENPSDQIIIVSTSNRFPQAEAYKQMIIERFNPKEVHIFEVYPNDGINIGPGLMAAYYYGKPISEGLKEETETFKQIVEALK